MRGILPTVPGAMSASPKKEIARNPIRAEFQTRSRLPDPLGTMYLPDRIGSN